MVSEVLPGKVQELLCAGTWMIPHEWWFRNTLKTCIMGTDKIVPQFWEILKSRINNRIQNGHVAFDRTSLAPGAKALCSVLLAMLSATYHRYALH